jgi:hypothetical protein
MEYLAQQNCVTQRKYSSIFPTFIQMLSKNHLQIAIDYMSWQNIWIIFMIPAPTVRNSLQICVLQNFGPFGTLGDQEVTQFFISHFLEHVLFIW